MQALGTGVPVQSPAMRNDTGIPHNSASCTGKYIIHVLVDLIKWDMSIGRVCFDEISGSVMDIPSPLHCPLLFLRQMLWGLDGLAV